MIKPPTRLELARRARGLTQFRLAGAAGVSRSTIATAERGPAPSPDSQRRIAGALGADTADIWQEAYPNVAV